MKYIIKGMQIEELEKLITDNGFSKFRASQIYNWLYKNCVNKIDMMENLSSDLRLFLKENSIINTLELSKKVVFDNTTKFLFKTKDNQFIETVSMIENDKHTICLSSQVGCSVDCDFCATGKMGFKSSLSVGEILDQLIYIKKYMTQPITNIVFMGMGEPFLNYKNVIKSADIMNDSLGLNFGSNRITISTAGILPKINQFINEKKKYNLAISLNASNDKVRDKIMPINKKWPIADLIKVSKVYNKNKRNRITFEYVLIDSVNDSNNDAIQLCDLLKNTQCKLNIIPFNHIGNQYKRPSSIRIEKFIKTIHQNHKGFTILVRWSKGTDINAGCGQLSTGEI